MSKVLEDFKAFREEKKKQNRVTREAVQASVDEGQKRLEILDVEYAELEQGDADFEKVSVEVAAKLENK